MALTQKSKEHGILAQKAEKMMQTITSPTVEWKNNSLQSKILSKSSLIIRS
jgi:hypothetical protein